MTLLGDELRERNSDIEKLVPGNYYCVQTYKEKKFK